MRFEFDPLADAAYLEFSNAEIEETRTIEPGIIADYDANGHMVGIEILYISKRSGSLIPLKAAA